MIYLLRHGLDDEDYIGGWSTGDLIEEGVEATHEIAKYIISQEYKIDKIYSSDVKRAVTTTEIVNKYLNKPIEYMTELRELDKGDLTGLRRDIAHARFPDFIDVKEVDVRYPNGQCMLDLYKSTKELLNKFLLHQDDILVVTHRGIINMLYYILNDIEVTMDKKRFGVVHSSLHAFDPKVKKIERIR